MENELSLKCVYCEIFKKSIACLPFKSSQISFIIAFIICQSANSFNSMQQLIISCLYGD